MQKELLSSVKKAVEFLLNNQNEEGSWYSTTIDYKGPTYLQKAISVTPQVIDSLVYLNLEDNSQINKAILYCFKEKLDIADPTELLALQLLALNYSNTKAIGIKAKQLVEFILKKQSDEGYWHSFPKISNLTTFFVIPSIREYECKENIEKAKNWILNSQSKDNLGWGANEEAGEAQISFTANAILSLLEADENIKNKKIQDSIEFIKSKQLKDGGWPSSSLTYNKDSTTYATALVCLALIKTGKINNDNRENK